MRDNRPEWFWVDICFIDNAERLGQPFRGSKF